MNRNFAAAALLSRRWAAIRDVGLSGIGAWLICVLLVAVALGFAGPAVV